MIRHLLLALLLALPVCATAAPPQEQWFAVLLDGRKIGSFHVSRGPSFHGGLQTTQELDLVFDRAGVALPIHSFDSYFETPDGKPLRFQTRNSLSSGEIELSATIGKGSILVTHDNRRGASWFTSLDWQEGAVMVEGQRLAALRAGLHPGARYEVTIFQPTGLDFARASGVVEAREEVELPGGRRSLWRTRQMVESSLGSMASREWVDEDYVVHKAILPMLGSDLVLVACDRACAQAPNQTIDLVARSMLPAPRALGADELAGTLRYTLAASAGQGLPALAPPVGSEQEVASDGTNWTIIVRRAAQARGEAPPGPADLQANEWMQGNAPEILDMARRATTGADTPAARMERIESFVRGYIHTKSLGVGYASALEVVRHPEGDCTEHALLVGALGRAAGIPTRIAFGFAYAPGFAGHEQVFVPHAWAQAWTGDRWRSYDAALAGFDAGHIALAVGDGDPWRFYAGLEALGRLQVRTITSIPAAHAGN